MSAPNTKWCAPSAAFAAGITATVAISTLISGSPLGASKFAAGSDAAHRVSSLECSSGGDGCMSTREEAAHPSKELHSKERAWSDPVRSIGSPEASSQQPSTQLTFHPDADDDRDAPDEIIPTSAFDRVRRETSRLGTSVGAVAKPLSRLEPAQPKAAENSSLPTKVNLSVKDTSFRSGSNLQQSRIGRAQSTQSQSAKAYVKAEKRPSAAEQSAAFKDQPYGLENQSTLRLRMANNPSAKPNSKKSTNLADNQNTRLNLKQSKEISLPQTRQSSESPQAAIQSKSRFSLREVNGLKTRSSSAGSEGIMSWLQENDGG